MNNTKEYTNTIVIEKGNVWWNLLVGEPMETNVYNEGINKLIKIAESFDKWLEEVSKEFEMNKDDVQALIKTMLN